jgi:hypothetical protein
MSIEVSSKYLQYKTFSLNQILDLLSEKEIKKSIHDKTSLFIYDYEKDLRMHIEYIKKDNMFYIKKSLYNDYIIEIQECLTKINKMLNIESIIEEIIKEE